MENEKSTKDKIAVTFAFMAQVIGIIYFGIGIAHGAYYGLFGTAGDDSQGTQMYYMLFWIFDYF